MSARVVTEIVCDNRCGSVATRRAATISATRSAIQTEGWRYLRREVDGALVWLDLCPQCYRRKNRHGTVRYPFEPLRQALGRDLSDGRSPGHALSIAEVARQVGRPERTVYRWIDNGLTAAAADAAATKVGKPLDLSWPGYAPDR